MKFTSSVVVALAPLAMGRRVARDGHLMQPESMPMYEPAPAMEYPAPAAPPAMEYTAPAAPPAMTHPAAAMPPPMMEMPAEMPPAQMIWACPGGGASTTTIHEKVTVTQTIVAGEHPTEVPMHDGATTTIMQHETATVPAAGASHTVTVGGPAGLVFQPDQLQNVPVGDTIIFEFLSQNHTVTQSPFDTPCDKIPDGMDSGFMANPNNTVVPPPQVAMQVMGEAPLWFYCKQANHCGMGMVFSVNPTAEKTQAMFQQKAIEQKGNGKASPITGGETAPPAAAPPAAAPPAQGGGVGNVPGQGQVVGGSCVCMVSCSAGAFPSAQQGINAHGGIAGSLPMMGGIS